MENYIWHERVPIFEEAKQKNPEIVNNIEFPGIENLFEEIANCVVESAEEDR
jgi:hypothetical protein